MNNLKQRIIFLFIALILSIIHLSAGVLLANDAAVTVSLENETINLNPPFEIKSAMTAKDGGTLSIVVEDGQKNSLHLCFDNRLSVPQESRYLYADATYPDDAQAKRVPFCSEAQDSIVAILKSAKIDESNVSANKNVVQGMIQRLENQCAKPFSISGEWETSFGHLTFTQDGSIISGSYTHDNGKIEGKLQGRILRGQWSESPTYSPSHDAGDFEFEFSVDTKTFTGHWRYGFDKQTWDGTWNGNRLD